MNQPNMSEMVLFIEKLGKELGWKSRYMDLATTATAAVFRSLQLDEYTDTIPLGTEHASEQLEALQVDLQRRGRSPGTAATYATTWKRISKVAGGWVEVRGTPDEDTYWNDIDRFRDTRRKRRHRVKEATPVSSYFPHLS